MEEMIIKQFERNGKMWERVLVTCPRCGGCGNYSYNYQDGTVCYGCGGTGKVQKDRRSLTDKEKAQRERANERRRAKAEAEKDNWELERNKRANDYSKRERFFGLDTLYIVAIENTYDLKDEIKANGGRWNSCLQRWCFTEQTDKYPTVAVNYEDIIITNKHGITELKLGHREYVKSLITPQASTQKYIGVEKEKMEMDLTLKSVHGYENQYGEGAIFKFETPEGDVVTWFTGTKPQFEVGNTYKVRFTVKAHVEYQGECQTVVTRLSQI